MKNSAVIAISLIIGLTLGVIGGVVYASDDTQAAGFTSSTLPGGGLEVPHNERFHLSTDQRWIYSEGHLSDLIRLQWTADRAKPAIAWVNEKGLDKAAIITHAKANNPEDPDHNHISVETTMSPEGDYANQLFTRLEIPFDQDVAEIRTHSANFNVVDGILRIAGTEGVQRDLQFARTEKGNKVSPRWTIRADHDEETGADEGSNLQIIRYSDEGEAMDTSLMINRSSGHVGIGVKDAEAKLDVGGDSIRIRESKTPASSTAPGKVGEIAWDNGYLYICIAENKWKRTALETW